jgi:4-hydroxy-3-methylbut-2-enyl diphosphate reductase
MLPNIHPFFEKIKRFLLEIVINMVYFIVMDRKIYLTADVFGMCGGVHAALKVLEGLLTLPDKDVFVFHELVHNHSVTDSFTRKGVTFAASIEEIPSGATLVIGAHGVSPEVETSLRARAGKCLDATCPLVKKLHHIADSLTDNDQLILFGKAGHPEVAGVAGHSGTPHLHLISSPDEVDALPSMDNPVFISQTTVDHDEVEKALLKLRKRFPNLKECSGICDASKKRQAAVIKLAGEVDCVIVIGSNHSSNAKRLREIAERAGAAAFLIDNASMLTPEILSFSSIGITSGASTPQYLFDEVIAVLEKHGFVNGN